MTLTSQQDWIDRQIVWKKKLLETTTDMRKRESIEKDLETLEALRGTMRRHRAFIDAIHTVRKMPDSQFLLSETPAR